MTAPRRLPLSLPACLMLSLWTGVLAGALHGCASQQAAPAPVVEAPAEPQAPPEPEVVYKPFPRDTLYSLLVAEFAGKRGQPDLALGYYLDEARKTRDVGVIARASTLARALRKDRAALDAALLWIEKEPSSPEAHFIAALALSGNERHAEALDEMQKVSALGGMTNYTTLVAGSLDAPLDTRNAILARIDTLLAANPQELDLMVSRVLLLEKAGQREEALTQVRSARAAEPANTRLVSMEAKLLLQLGREEEALQVYARTLDAFPQDQRLRLQYARLLTRTNLKAAQEQFGILAEQSPGDSTVVFSLALIEYENNELESSATHFEQLLALGERQSDAHYYLGRIAQRKNDLDGALREFEQVKSGDSYMMALKQRLAIYLNQRDIDGARRVLKEARESNPDDSIRLTILEADLLTELKRYNDARALLTDAIKRNPDNYQLLYARSLVAEKLGDVKQLEADLRHILVKDPNNAMALNALGYSLADKTSRLDEALQLIERAYELNPDDPAIMDSLGWVNYRLKRYDRAEQLLTQAFAQMPDHEVAAHLGEVLWVKGDRERATQVWQAGLAQQPDSALIRATLQRFKVELPAPAAAAPSGESSGKELLQ
jgi:tetratricopeptide (TPR) repeat protein